MILSIFLLTTCAFANPPYAGLPSNAKILEERVLPSTAAPNRGLLLWIEAPPNLEEHRIPQSFPYTCPDQTLGDHYTAPTRVSLVDTKARNILNTVEIRLGSLPFSIPFAIRPGNPYHVPGPLENGAGKPQIFRLRDFNDDGQALEFAFYVQESCSSLLTLMLGYSVRQDRVIIYGFHIRDKLASPGAPLHPETWMFRFTEQKPSAHLRWLYKDFFNSGWEYTFDIRYNPAAERFEGTVKASTTTASPAEFPSEIGIAVRGY